MPRHFLELSLDTLAEHTENGPERQIKSHYLRRTPPCRVFRKVNKREEHGDNVVLCEEEEGPCLVFIETTAGDGKNKKPGKVRDQLLGLIREAQEDDQLRESLRIANSNKKVHSIIYTQRRYKHRSELGTVRVGNREYQIEAVDDLNNAPC